MNFLHLGKGTAITTPIPGVDPNVAVNAGPGMFSPLPLLLCLSLSTFLFPSCSRMRIGRGVEGVWRVEADNETGSFNWNGSPNFSWFLCPKPGKGYQVFKQVSNAIEGQGCLSGITVVAVDVEG